MSRPVTLDIFKSLFEVKRQILSLIVTYYQTLNKDVTILLKILLEEYNVEVNFVKSLYQAFFIIAYLCQ